jgi:antitoxin component of MazEF toxin-antitoxin module
MTLTKVRRIGNSKGILLPKTVLEESGIKGTVKIVVKDKVIMISSAEAKKKKT